MIEILSYLTAAVVAICWLGLWVDGFLQLGKEAETDSPDPGSADPLGVHTSAPWSPASWNHWAARERDALDFALEDARRARAASADWHRRLLEDMHRRLMDELDETRHSALLQSIDHRHH